MEGLASIELSPTQLLSLHFYETIYNQFVIDFSLGPIILDIFYMESVFETGEFFEIIQNLDMINQYRKIENELDEKLKKKPTPKGKPRGK